VARFRCQARAIRYDVGVMPKLLLLGCAFAALAWAAIPEPIKVETGLLTGVPGKSAEVRVFKGIPFAAPPVGELRWRAPQPAVKWEGVRKADEFGALCMQTAPAAAQGNPPRMSEDCLYLNIFTAAGGAGEKRPVMVWLHPGGYTSGSGSSPAYDGESFARRGVVVVTINYRLGAFGFFSHPELTKESDRRWAANQAFLDQTAALEWVKANISAFGGDSGNVTIFGNSAGASSIGNLVASPRTKGLYHRAIAESGAWLGLSISPARKLDAAEQAGAKRSSSLKDLRALPAGEVLKLGGGGPVVDGHFLPKDPAEIFARGDQNKVPLIGGSNKDEGTFFLQPTTAAAWKQRVEQRYGERWHEYLELYPAATDDQATQSQFDAFRDELNWVMRNWVRLQTKAGAKSYLYFFTHQPPGPPLWPARASGATHGGEAQFLWNNLIANRPWREVDRDVANYMQSYWVNFAITGDPNGVGLPRWAPYDEKKNRRAMVFADSAAPAAEPDDAKLAFFESWYQKTSAGR
jgi:para-nitrobenzyl esterase